MADCGVCRRVRRVLRARHGKSCHKARHFAPAAAAGDRYFAEQHPNARGGIVLIHARHPQPLHDAATNATAEHNNLPTSTQMTEWLQMLGASSQILLHRALARTTVTATGTRRGRLSRVTNPSASVYRLRHRAHRPLWFTERALSSLFNFCGAYARISSMGLACRRGSKRPATPWFLPTEP